MRNLLQVFTEHLQLTLLCIIILVVCYANEELTKFSYNFENKYFAIFMLFFWFVIMPSIICYYQFL